MKVFISGSSGFIGSHLVERMLRDGHEVTGYDNLSSGKIRDTVRFQGNPRFRFFQQDIRNLDKLKAAMAGHDVVFHLAANGDIPRGRTDPYCDLENNTLGTHNILESMRANGVPKIVFASTAAVYGNGAGNGTPLAETFAPLFPISHYAASKLACEGLISAYCHLYGLEGTIFRFANVVGGKMNHGALFDNLQKLKRNPSEIDVWGNGNGEKPFILIDCIVDGILSIFRADRLKDCDVFNLGTNTHTKISRAVEILIEETGLKDVKINYGPEITGFAGDVAIVHFDPSKANSYGWKARYTSDEAVRIASRRLIDDVM